MRDLQAIQADINMMDQAIQGGGSIDNLDTWKVEKEKYEREFVDATAYWEGKQAHEGRVQEATTEITTRLDTLYLGGQTLRELCADEEAYQILRISFTQDYISQATKNSEVLSQVQTEANAAIKQANDRANNLDEQNTELLQQNHKLSMDLEDITSRFKAAELLLSEAPSSEETDKLKQEVADLKAQLELKAKAEEPKGDAKSQIDAMVQERENKKRKVTNLRLADPSGINTKDYLATDVLTGEELEIHSNYIRSYKEVSEEEAEQIRADKKVELEAQQAAIPTLEVPEIPPVNNVLEEEATTKEESFREESGHELGEGLLVDGQHVSYETSEETEESEVAYVTQRDHQLSLETVFVTIHQLSNRVSELEMSQRAVA